jgi:ribulose-5-phosphate 4-epimerase/fuculose-1-phosphate aldolase
MRVSDLHRVSDEGVVIEGDRPIDASATSIHAPIYKAAGRGPHGVEAIVHVHGSYSKGELAILDVNCKSSSTLTPQPGRHSTGS